MKAGDYIRTEYGIAKLQEITKRSIITDVMLDNGYSSSKDYFKILKSSPNIIDLIEVGDYVNGRYVDKYQGKLGTFYELPNGKWEFIELSNEHYLISSIVTKEQFSSMEYKVESEVN